MSALPARYSFTAWENTTFRKRITVLQGGTGSAPRNFTGYTGTMAIYSAPEVPTPLYTLTTSNGGITFGGTAGTIDLYIPASTTTTFEWAAGVYELIVIDTGGSGDSDPLLWGPFSVRGLT